MFQYELGVFVGKSDEVRAAQRDQYEPDEGRHHFNHVYSPVEPCARTQRGVKKKVWDERRSHVRVGLLTNRQSGHHEGAAVEQGRRFRGNVTAEIRQQLFLFFGEQTLFRLVLLAHFRVDKRRFYRKHGASGRTEIGQLVNGIQNTFTFSDTPWDVDAAYQLRVTVVICVYVSRFGSPTVHNVFVTARSDHLRGSKCSLYFHTRKYVPRFLDNGDGPTRRNSGIQELRPQNNVLDNNIICFGLMSTRI